MKNNGAGALALVVTGAIFLLIGCTGVIPTRLKIGENEVALTPEQSNVLHVVAQAQQATADGNMQRGQELVVELAQPQTAILALVPEAFERTEYERSLFTFMRDNLPPLWTIRTHVETPDYRFDAVLAGPTGEQVVCEIFVTSRFTGVQLLRGIESARNSQKERVDGVLIVSRTNAPGLERIRRGLEEKEIPVSTVVWTGEVSPGNEVLEALDAVISLIEK